MRKKSPNQNRISRAIKISPQAIFVFVEQDKEMFRASPYLIFIGVKSALYKKPLKLVL
jgi:hypothetical protein